MTGLRVVHRFVVVALAVMVVLLASCSTLTDAHSHRHVQHVVTPRGVMLRSSQKSICEQVCILFRRECIAGCNELPLIGGSDHIRRDGCIRYTCGFNYSRCRTELQCGHASQHKRDG